MPLREFAGSIPDVLHPVEQLDVLLLYGLMAEANSSYLEDREIASKVHIPNGPTLLKRGSDLEPLTIAEVQTAVDEEFLELRDRAGGLDEAQDSLSNEQAKVWRYFPPRKYCEFLYATNYEGEGMPIDRIFYDIDRGLKVTGEQAVDVTRAFVDFLEHDSIAQEITETMIISYTGNSFHVDFLLTASQPPEFYTDEVFTTEQEEVDTITDRGVRAVREAVDVSLVGGHARQAETVNIDPSQTPSGKLNRVPLGSLHMADAETVDGISVPVTKEELREANVLSKLRSYTPQTVIDDLDALQTKLP